MPAKLILAPEAVKDVDDAWAWYEDRRTGLGEEFLSCVEACIDTVCRTPIMYGTIHEDYRRALVRRFPYSVFYEYVENTVTIYAVFHTSRDPEKWRRRLS